VDFGHKKEGKHERNKECWHRERLIEDEEQKMRRGKGIF